jgi:hypothetical protein
MGILEYVVQCVEDYSGDKIDHAREGSKSDST